MATEYIADEIEQIDDDLAIWAVLTPDGNHLAVDETAQLLNTLTDYLARVTAERDEALALLREQRAHHPADAFDDLDRRTDAFLAGLK